MVSETEKTTGKAKSPCPLFFPRRQAIAPGDYPPKSHWSVYFKTNPSAPTTQTSFFDAEIP